VPYLYPREIHCVSGASEDRERQDPALRVRERRRGGPLSTN
jgi:hypothetical protein